MSSYDVVVVGGGVGGYPAASALAQEGLRVALVEEGLLGGECVNYGCVPSKALLHASRVYWEAGSRLGLRVEAPGGWPWRWVSSVVDSVRRGVEELLSGAGVDVYRATARLAGRLPSGRVRVKLGGGGELEAGSVVLAPGSEPGWPPGVEGGPGVVDNRGFYSLKDTPGSAIVVGGGPVGVEASFALAWLGSRVTLVEAMNRVLPGMDRDLSAMAARGLRRAGVEVVTGQQARVEADRGGGVRALVGGEWRRYDLALVAVGRRPRTAGLGLESVGARVDGRGFIVVGGGQEAAPGVYAAGDAAGPPMLAHKAIMESLTAASRVAGLPGPAGRPLVPTVVYGDPEIASVGLTLREARERGIPAAEARFNLAASSRARIENDGLGLVKIVYSREDGSILGVHIAAPNAGEAVAAALEALEAGERVGEAAWRARPHPSIVESLTDALLEALGVHVHRVRGRRRG